MKRFFWLALLLNLGLLIYFNLELLLPASPDIRLSEISPEKIRVLTPQEIETLPLKTPEPEQISLTDALCHEWGMFSDGNLANAQKAINQMGLNATLKSQTGQQAKRFWVYRPPFKTAAEAQKKAAEYKALGFSDIFVIQEDKWKNAVSFGIFEDEQLAEKLLNELKVKGIKNVTKALRTEDAVSYSLIFRDLSEKDAAAIIELKPNFPGAALKQTSCAY